LNEQPAARLEPARHFADNRAAFGKMMQNRTDGDEVERRTRRFVIYDVKFADFEIASGNPLQRIGPDVGGDDTAGGSDALREPL
jgi:hypothetical protein